MEQNQRKGRMPAWLMIALALAGMILLIPALWVYVSLTAKPLYAGPEAVPTMMNAAPPSEWTRVVARGRPVVRAMVAERNLPGLSVAVGIGGGLVWAEGFGFADLKSGAPVTPNHRFRIGTSSAVLTSAAAGLLLDEGRLRLGEEIQTYVPGFPKKQWPVTLGKLMAQTSGMTPDADDDDPLFNKHCEGTQEALPYFSARPLLFQPGTRYGYSSHGWILVSAAVEAASGTPFAAFMRERIFDPLGMRDTRLDTATADPAGEDFPLANMVRELIYDPDAKRGAAAGNAGSGRVTPYFTRFDSDPKYGLHLMRPLDYSCYAGASGFASTPSDLVRFGMAVNGGRLLRPTTVELLQAPQRLASGAETGYGFGWYEKTVSLGGKPTRLMGHDGDSLGGMVASLLTVPERGLVVAVTANVSFADTFTIAAKLAEAFVEPDK